MFKAALALVLVAAPIQAQQMLQRGPFGKITQVVDDTGQWSTPISVASSRDVEIYIPDISSPTWLKSNYTNFMDRGQYVISMFTLYRNPNACRANQTGWGLADQAHFNACATDIGYRLRQATVDTNLKTVTLIQAGMLDPDGNLDNASIQREPLTRRWAELDPNTQAALAATTDLVTKQMARYDKRVQSAR